MTNQPQTSRQVSATNPALIKRVPNYSHKVWRRRAQDAKEIAHTIQEQIASLNGLCAVAVEHEHHGQPASQLHQHAKNYDGLSTQLKNLSLLLHHVPLTSPDHGFVMARLKSTCTHLRQIELWADIHGRPGRPHGTEWKALANATQQFRSHVYAVIGQPTVVH